jgi:hypothetical protein
MHNTDADFGLVNRLGDARIFTYRPQQIYVAMRIEYLDNVGGALMA